MKLIPMLTSGGASCSIPLCTQMCLQTSHKYSIIIDSAILFFSSRLTLVLVTSPQLAIATLQVTISDDNY